MILKEQNYDGEHANGQWVEINDYHSPHQQSPMQEYNGFAYMPASHITSDAGYSRPVTSTYSNQTLQPMGAAQWPSMLTNPSTTLPPATIAHPPLAPVSTVISPSSLPPLSTPQVAPSARRTLTDQDRRRMCQYHEDNPSVKQTEIGGK